MNQRYCLGGARAALPKKNTTSGTHVRTPHRGSMGRKKKGQRPMKGFSRVTFGSDDELEGGGGGTAVACRICGKLACFCVQDLGGAAAAADAGAGTAATGSFKALPVLNGDAWSALRGTQAGDGPARG